MKEKREDRYQDFSDSSHSAKKKSHKEKHKKKREKNKRSRSRSRNQHKRNKNRQHFENFHLKSNPKQQIPQNNIPKQQQIVKQLPNFQPSGILLKYYNSREGVNLKFNEPPEARTPNQIWRIYIFKGQEVLQPILLKNSSYLIGKDPIVCDIVCQNPSISRQHAVIQFRLISKLNIDGTYEESVKPYILDLQSTNGTILNDEKIQNSRYIELLHKDVLKFGFSERQYVIVKQQQEQEIQQEIK